MKAMGILLALVMAAWASGADRINQEGRILGPPLLVTNAILFNTPEADAILASMQIFPVTNAWNEDISKRPLLANSDAMIAQVKADLATNRQTLRVFFEMNFVLAPDNQPLVPIQFFNYADESDPSPYPIPTNLPIETWPRETGALTLEEWQQDVAKAGGDRHAIIVQPVSGVIWETWLTKLTTNGQWRASNGAKFDLKSNALRPSGWTSADAAGLPMFPALVRFDECERGAVEHAVRLIVKKTRREYIYPALHFASTNSAAETNLPAMGQRFRLNQNFATPGNWTKQEKALLYALKKYGAIVADNGNFFSISATPDSRWPDGAFDHISSINITNFEVIQTTGPNEGPRSPGAPRATTGALNIAPLGVAVELPGFVEFSGTAPATHWTNYSGPGTVSFSDEGKTNATATFAAAGDYVLMLSAADDVHAVSFGSLHVKAVADFRTVIYLAGSSVNLGWSGLGPNFVVEETTLLGPIAWGDALITNERSAMVPMTNGSGFFRVRSGP